MLKQLLTYLELQVSQGLFEYSAVIVDNDEKESARQIVESWSAQSNISIGYFVEPEQNISHARNRAVKNAVGDYIAFIDDDEYPGSNWLLSLYQAIHKYPCDGILGPVVPYYEEEPPGWVVKGNLFDRKSFSTGTVVRNVRYLRTGNLLLKRDLFDRDENLFDSRFGKTGGEDSDFFRRMIRADKCFVWCEEAFVNEFIPRERIRRSYLLRKAFLGGLANATCKKPGLFSIETQKSVAAIVLYTVALPALIFRHHLFMKYLIKDCHHISKVLAIFGLRVVKERTP